MQFSPSAVGQGSLQASPHRTALTIAGFDPSSGAGITADLKVFAAHSVYGVAAISALTVQSTKGVRRVESVSPRMLRETLGFLRKDIYFHGVKIGMLSAQETVTVVSALLREWLTCSPGMPVVLDPVLCSTSGHALLTDTGTAVLREELLPLVSCVTPNTAELAILCGRPQVTRDDIPAAARELQQLHPGAPLSVLVTGGHLDRPDDYLLTAAGKEHWLSGEHIETTAGHGTGCAFSSAVLCGLIAGQPIEQAAVAAKSYVAAALRAAYPIGHGSGPLHHLFAFDPGAKDKPIT